MKPTWMRCLVFSVTLLTGAAASSAPIVLDAQGARSVANLSQIALAFHNYHSVENGLPPAFLGSVGSPLLSWRVAILPYLGETALYDEFDLTKAWDDPVNIALLSKMPDVFRSPLAGPGSTNASYVVGLDANSIFPGSPGLNMSSIIDGTSNTILVGETHLAIPWTKPEDLTIGACPTLGGSGFASSVPGGVPFAFADGSVRILPTSIGCADLRGLFLRNDGITDSSMALDYVVGSVPEPGSLHLVAIAVLAFAIVWRFRKTPA